MASPSPGDGSSQPSVGELTVAEEIDLLLPETKGQLGLVAACLQEGVTDRNEIVAAGAAANNGAVGNLLLNIRAIRDGDLPPAPSNARLALGATRSILKRHGPVLSKATTAHLGTIMPD